MIGLTPNQFNQWRVIPRLLIAIYGYAFYSVIEWFMLLDAPTNSQAAFVSTVVGAGAVWFGFYVNSGNSSNE